MRKAPQEPVAPLLAPQLAVCSQGCKFGFRVVAERIPENGFANVSSPEAVDLRLPARPQAR